MEPRERVWREIVDISLFQPCAEPARVRKAETLFGDARRLRLLNFQERLDPILELRIEQLLMIRFPILLREIDGRCCHRQGDEHHRQEQLRAEAERRRKLLVEGNGLVIWLEN